MLKHSTSGNKHLSDMKCICHDLEVMSLNPRCLELGMRSTSVLSHTWTKNIKLEVMSLNPRWVELWMRGTSVLSHTWTKNIKLKSWPGLIKQVPAVHRPYIDKPTMGMPSAQFQKSQSNLFSFKYIRNKTSIRIEGILTFTYPLEPGTLTRPKA